MAPLSDLEDDGRFMQSLALLGIAWMQSQYLDHERRVELRAIRERYIKLIGADNGR